MPPTPCQCVASASRTEFAEPEKHAPPSPIPGSPGRPAPPPFAAAVHVPTPLARSFLHCHLPR